MQRKLRGLKSLDKGKGEDMPQGGQGSSVDASSLLAF